MFLVKQDYLKKPQSADYDDDGCSVYFGTTKFISPSSFFPSQEMTLRERGKLPVTIELRANCALHGNGDLCIFAIFYKGAFFQTNVFIAVLRPLSNGVR